MEDNPLWSRRGFLGMGVGVLGAAGLAACGSAEGSEGGGAEKRSAREVHGQKEF